MIKRLKDTEYEKGRDDIKQTKTYIRLQQSINRWTLGAGQGKSSINITLKKKVPDFVFKLLTVKFIRPVLCLGITGYCF